MLWANGRGKARIGLLEGSPRLRRPILKHVEIREIVDHADCARMRCSERGRKHLDRQQIQWLGAVELALAFMKQRQVVHARKCLGVAGPEQIGRQLYRVPQQRLRLVVEALAFKRQTKVRIRSDRIQTPLAVQPEVPVVHHSPGRFRAH